MQGCDASLLLTGFNSEQSYVPNQTLRQESLQLINQIKSTLEQNCPNSASCADIISQAAAEAIKQTKGPSIIVPAGRRDGTSTASQNTVSNGLPSPFNNVSQNMPIFFNLGFDYTDFVALSGAHTLGQAHCSAFSGRLRPTFDVNLLGCQLKNKIIAHAFGSLITLQVHSLIPSNKQLHSTDSM
ncbi:unnamed protein product [Calypogeia fissa]